MAKVATNISLDAGLKAKAQELFSDFGLDLTTAITLFLSQAVREQRIPFEIKRIDTSIDPLQEYKSYKQDPSAYTQYRSFREAREKLSDAGEI